MKTKILIIEDHPLFREGLKSIIRRDERFVVAGETGNGEEGLALAKKLKPDLILLDITLPGMSGVQATRGLKKLLPEVRILIVSMHAGVTYVVDAFQSGADGYLAKESASEQLVAAMSAVLAGKRFVDNTLSTEIVGKLIEYATRESHGNHDPYSHLAPREQEVLRLLVCGRSLSEIARDMNLSIRTIEKYRYSIFDKLNVRSDVELYRYAAQIGLTDVTSV